MENEQRKKSTKTVISFVVIGIFLIVLFFAAANIGSLKVSARQMFDGFIIAYDKMLQRSMICVFQGYYFHVSRCSDRCIGRAVSGSIKKSTC